MDKAKQAKTVKSSKPVRIKLADRIPNFLGHIWNRLKKFAEENNIHQDEKLLHFETKAHERHTTYISMDKFLENWCEDQQVHTWHSKKPADWRVNVDKFEKRLRLNSKSVLEESPEAQREKEKKQTILAVDLATANATAQKKADKEAEEKEAEKLMVEDDLIKTRFMFLPLNRRREI